MSVRWRTNKPGAPFISGPPEVGETLTADTSQIMDSDGLSRPGYRHQWVRVASGGLETDIPRAMSAMYRVTEDDVGVALKVNTTFTDDKGNPESAERAHGGGDRGPGGGLLRPRPLCGGGRRLSQCEGRLEQGPAPHCDDHPDCRAARGSDPCGPHGADRGCLQRRGDVPRRNRNGG